MYNLMPTCTQMEDILSCKERLSLGLLSCFAFFLDYVTDLRYLFCCVLKSCLRINYTKDNILQLLFGEDTWSKRALEMVTRAIWKCKCKQSLFIYLFIYIYLFIFIVNSVVISVVNVRWNRQQKRGTCFASLLQSKLKSDVAHVTTQESNLSCNKWVCFKLRKVLAKSRQ